jgi:hypothetical protein
MEMNSFQRFNNNLLRPSLMGQGVGKEDILIDKSVTMLA